MSLLFKKEIIIMTIRIPVAKKPNQTFKDKKKYDRKKARKKVNHKEEEEIL
jgi:hypothetical protein